MHHLSKDTMYTMFSLAELEGFSNLFLFGIFRKDDDMVGMG
jgi:hypothetical protein